MGSFTIALLQALLSAGVSPERARDVVDLFDRSVGERYSLHAQVLAALTTQTALIIGAIKVL